MYRNLIIVFTLTGFWHGASWNFLIWGWFHGTFLMLENTGFKNTLNALWKPMQHLYLLLVVVVGWVFFRAENLSEAVYYISVMFNPLRENLSNLQYNQFVSNEAIFAFVFALILSTPIFRLFSNYFNSQKTSFMQSITVGSINIIILGSLLFLSILKISASTYNPFIYFRF